MRLFRKLIKIKGNNNQIISPKSKSNQLYKRSPIDIHGDNNLINIDDCNSIYKFHLIIHGSGNVINIGRNVEGILKLVVTGNNCQIQIGQNCTFRGCEIAAFENNSNLVIGNDCIIARDTRIYASDFHTIYDCTTKQPLNHGTHVCIGNHVWLGEAAMILKNNTIADNVIVAARSIVTKDLKESYAVYAGHPAILKKRGINWDVREYKEYSKDVEKLED